MGSRGFSGHSKSLPEGSQHPFQEKMCSETSPRRVWDTFGTPSGRLFGKEKRSRSGSEQVFVYNQVETSFSKGLEWILGPIIACFYVVCRCDRTHENNDTATLRIFKNICVFTVILHIHVVEEARLKTKIKVFYGFVGITLQKTILDLLKTLIWRPLGVPNTSQNGSKTLSQ